MTNRNEERYTCENCSNTVHPYTYRASCPDCGGPLRAGGTR